MDPLDQEWPSWTHERHIDPGMYLYRSERSIGHKVMIVKRGDWQLAQNPVALYANGAQLDGVAAGWWLGPIPKSPTDSVYSAMFEGGNDERK